MFKFAARIWVIILAVVMMLSLGFNVAVVGFASVGAAVGGIYDAVTGTKSAVTALREQRDRLTRDITAKEGRIAQLTDDIAIRDARVASLTDEIADLKRTRSVMYRGERRPLREAITDTNKRIARRTAAAAGRNASSVVAEAIPYLGIAAMLGVTGYDLKDSCDTIKDLHTLDVALDSTRQFGQDETEVCGLRVPTKEEVWQSVKDNSSEAWIAAGRYVPNLPEFELPTWWRVLRFWDYIELGTKSNGN